MSLDRTTDFQSGDSRDGQDVRRTDDREYDGLEFRLAECYQVRRTSSPSSSKKNAQ